MVVQHLEGGDGLILTFHAHQVDLAQQRLVPHCLDGGLAYQHRGTVELGRSFEPRRKVHAVADHGIVHALGRADVAGHDNAGGDADADGDLVLSGGATAHVQFRQGDQHAARDGDRVVGIGIAGEGGAEQRHDGVADVFVEDAAVVEDDLDHIFEVFVQHRHRAARAQSLGNGREVTHVGEQDRDPLVLALQRILAAFEKLIGHLLRHVARHRGLDPLFAGHVLEDQHRSDVLVGDVDQRHRRQVERSQRTAGEVEIGVHGQVRLPALGDLPQAVEDPRVVVHEELGRRALDE